MSSAATDLLAYAADRVTPADVRAFAPSDPGYWNYVHSFEHILLTRELPRRATFDITETIGLTRWTSADAWSNPTRFRWFRVLTTAVGLSLCLAGQADVDLPPNYTIVTLIDDANALRDQALLRLARPALVEYHSALADSEPNESPFALLGVLLIDAQLGQDLSVMSAFADRLIQEEGQPSERGSHDFLFGLTPFDQLNRRWRWLVDRLLKPATPSLSLLRAAVLCEVR